MMRNSLTLTILLLFAISPTFAVTVSAKYSGSVSPISLAAVANSNYSITGWNIYVDSNLVYRQNTSSSSLTQLVSMSSGTHKITVKAWDSTGASGSASLTVSVTSGSSAYSTTTTVKGLIPNPPSTAKIFSNVDQWGGWSACSACANGTTATYWLKQGVSSPSIDGKSMEGYIKGGYKQWADDLFVYRFGDQRWANHILWSVTFRWNAPKIKQPNGQYVVQAIEFDSLFLDDGFKYMFGTQCDYGKGVWDVWNNNGRYWQHTSVACQKWGPNTWHTVTWYLERDPVHKYIHYAVLQVDGTQYKVDKWLPAVGVASNHDFKVQWEQDTDLYGDPWYMWVDKVKATIW